MVRAIIARNATVDLAPAELPTDTEYRIAMYLALRPFFTHLESVNYRVEENDAALLAKIDEAMRTIMKMKLRTKQPAHLYTVLVLQKWRGAITGSVEDQNEVTVMTGRLVHDYPWLIDINASASAGQ